MKKCILLKCNQRDVIDFWSTYKNYLLKYIKDQIFRYFDNFQIILVVVGKIGERAKTKIKKKPNKYELLIFTYIRFMP